MLQNSVAEDQLYTWQIKFQNDVKIRDRLWKEKTWFSIQFLYKVYNILFYNKMASPFYCKIKFAINRLNCQIISWQMFVYTDGKGGERIRDWRSRLRTSGSQLGAAGSWSKLRYGGFPASPRASTVTWPLCLDELQIQRTFHRPVQGNW